MEKKGFSFLLVQHHAGHWGFPKGHIEKGETSLETAKREVFEEVGISYFEIVDDLYFQHEYLFFDRKRGLINKKVGFFVGEVYDKSVVLQKSELKSYAWSGFEDSMNLLTFDADKDILKSAYETIKLSSS